MYRPLKGKWCQWGLLNLAIVALYGSLMRYKIAFSLPVFEQKNLLHAHSHFAFSGWISHVLYCGLALMMAPYITTSQQKKYNRLILLNLLCSFGMLLAFTLQGYKAIAIGFSTLSIFIAISFAYLFLLHAKNFPASFPAKPWAITGLLLDLLSAVGPFSLAYMMGTKNIDHHFYLATVYYYLHFQYNGWFFFGAMALAAWQFSAVFAVSKTYFRLFAFTVIPTFFLSLLWTKLPLWLYVVTVLATILQLVTWAFMMKKFWSKFKQTNNYPGWINFFFCAAAVALTAKFLLQAISVIPSLSQLVFGIRPIVIAYLHLVLLGVYSLFILGYMLANGVIKRNRLTRKIVFTFFTGVLLNELLLAIQGIAAFFYIPVPHINELLFGAALVLLYGAGMLFISQVNKEA